MNSEQYKIEWVGYNGQENHDKVWGWLVMKDRRIYCFWGRRGKQLRFKQHDSLHSVNCVQKQKQDKKGYLHVPPEQYDNLVKDFLSDVEVWCATAILSENVM